MGISIAISARAVWIRRVTVKQCFFTVVTADDFYCRSMLYLYTQKPLRNLREIFDASQPP